MKHIIAGIAATLMPMRIGKIPIMLWRPDNPEQMVLDVSETEFGTEEKIPYWAILWPSAIALAEFIANSGDLEGKSMLELGAGLALPSLVAAKSGANVLTTDWYLESLIFADANAAANRIQLNTKLLDWTNPPADLKFDLIIGADILYEARSHEPVISLLEKMLAPNGIALISDPNRPRNHDFQRLANERGWQSKAFPVDIDWEGSTQPTTVWEIKRS